MSVSVVCRVRPPAREEKAAKRRLTVEDNDLILWKDPAVRFSFDHVLDDTQSQRDVFEIVRPLLWEVLDGYEATLFAYGQTGTGKTHTMMGDLHKKNLQGLIPRSADFFFEGCKSQDTRITVSFLEIYNEELSDLLSPGKRIHLLENERQGVVLKNLSHHAVRNVDEVMALLHTAQERQKISETRMNKVSSRSHCIFTMKLRTQKKSPSGDTIVTGKLHLVDLAGSECGKDGGGGQLEERERRNINQSLLVLGRVVGALKEGDKQRVPYRDSKLTRLLKESLGGRCKTVLIATLSPSIYHIEETHSTLQYARNALQVVNSPMRNERLVKPAAQTDVHLYLKEALYNCITPCHEKLEKALAHLVEEQFSIPFLTDQQMEKMIEKRVVEHFRLLEETGECEPIVTSTEQEPERTGGENLAC